jgi:AcrR family transcriptional regulator
MTQPDFLRARRPEHKHQRRETILAAARDLAQRSGVRNVSLGDVATAVGLAKSNVVRYFRTREEIYLELAVESWREWERAAGERLRTAGGPDDVAGALAETLAERPLFCDILTQATTTLEHNVSVPALYAFKKVALEVITGLGRLACRACPSLTEAECVELVSAAPALAAVLYPISNPPPALAEVYARHPEMAVLCPAFTPGLKRALAAIAAGLPSLRAS